MTLKLKPGELISEKEIADILNVSRTPIHEVLLLLKENELIDISPRSSSKVSLINIGMVREGFQLRNTIEPKIYQQISGNITVEHINKLTENLEKQKQLTRNKNSIIDEFFTLDDEFHQLLYSAANKDFTWKGVKHTCSHFDRVRYLDSDLEISNGTDKKALYEEHYELFNNLLFGGIDSPEFYEAYVYNHLNHFKDSFSSITELYKDFFEF